MTLELIESCLRAICLVMNDQNQPVGLYYRRHQLAEGKKHHMLANNHVRILLRQRTSYRLAASI